VLAAAGRPGAPRQAGGDSVADAVAYAGDDAVRYWLARMPAGRAGALDGAVFVSRDPARSGETQPYSAQPYLTRDLAVVRFACADAAATTRWAVELGLHRAAPGSSAAGQLGLPAESALLTQLSWLAERVAAAARRCQPDELPRLLERLAAAWLACRESCPALPFGGTAAPRDRAGISARLWLAEATRTALAAGLDLIGLTPRLSDPF
ncbi:MAG: DALR anticodon-binding domain-containing protein, partial [Streptosporangiaceae bacterium]